MSYTLQKCSVEVAFTNRDEGSRTDAGRITDSEFD